MTAAPADRSGRANYATTDALSVRLDTMRRFLRSAGPFGLEVLAREDVDGRRVLEVGCGTGEHAVRMLERTGARPASWTLLDRSEALARTALRAVGARASARAVVADMQRLPLARGGRFDLVVAMHCLQHVRSPRRVVRALAARLAPGGRMLVTASGHECTRSLRLLHGRALRAHGVAGGRAPGPAHDVRRAERDLRCAFADVEMIAREAALEIPDADAVARYYASMPWDFAGISPPRLVEFVRHEAAIVIARSGSFRIGKAAATLVGSRPL